VTDLVTYLLTLEATCVGCVRGSFFSVLPKRKSDPRSSIACGFISVCRYLVGLQGRNKDTICAQTGQHTQTMKMCLHAKNGIRTHCSSVRVVGTCDNFNRYLTFSIKFACNTCESNVWAKELLIFQIHSIHFKIIGNKMLE
jgi:hypothetical protein